MAKILSGLVLMITLVSCYRTEPEPVFNMSLVLPADSMVNLITDMHLADGVINTIKDKKKSVKPLATEYFEAVLQKHSITKAVFDESMRYYSFHAEKLNDIYEKVIIALSKKESTVLPAKEAGATPEE
jgi:hypothetical protein